MEWVKNCPKISFLRIFTVMCVLLIIQISKKLNVFSTKGETNFKVGGKREKG